MNAKKLLAILTAGLMGVSLMGCELVSVNKERDDTQIVLRVGDETFTKAYVNQIVDTQLSYYGITDPNEASIKDQVETFRKEMLESLAQTEVMRQEALAQGYVDKLTEEELSTIQTEYDKQVTYYDSGIVEELQEEYEGDVDKDAKIEKKRQEALQTFLENNRIDKIEDYLTALKEQKALEKFQQEVKDRVQVSDEDLKAEYDKLLGEQKVSYDGSAAAYISASSGSTVQVYAPAGVRRVKHILIAIPEDTKTALKALQEQITTYTTNGDTAKVEETQKQYDEKLAEALSGIEEKAEAALKRAKNGEDFDKLIEELGEDPGMKTNKDGYAVHETSTGTYEENFQTAAMALGKVGDISPLVDTVNGYHIIKYTADVPAGEVGLDAVRDKLKESLTTTKQEDALEEKGQSLADTYREQGKLETFPDRLKAVSVPGKDN